MLTSKQLYEEYSTNPCDEGFFPSNDPLRGTGKFGRGTPHFMKRMVQFMKHLKYPCITNAPRYEDIQETGSDNLCLTYKFLESLDSECFKEIQPTIKSGTSHSIRNSCDISRACSLIYHKIEATWEHRMATEYLQYFGENSLPDCLMVLGPDLVSNNFAYENRAPNVGEMSCLPIEKDGPGATGATWRCMEPPFALDPKPECRSCPYCELLPDGTPINPDDPCCKFDSAVDYQNLCCGAPLTTRADFSLLISTDFEQKLTNFRPNTIRFIPVDNFNQFISVVRDYNTNNNSVKLSISQIREIELWVRDKMKINDAIMLLDGNIYVYSNPFFESSGAGNPGLTSSQLNFITKYNIRAYNIYYSSLKHVGILPRKIYGGYANFLDNSGGNFYGIVDDIFLDYFRSINNYNYSNDTTSLNLLNETDRERFSNNTRNNILRARTISMISADTDIAVQEIKDLLWNGYGVVLFSNVGFPNTKDSQGISYPDRMWYTTYSIIGYDDTKTEYDECVYILHCPWGRWNEGGQPYWGDLPDGSFLVTEQHLKCMLKIYADRDYFDCRNKLPCNRAIHGNRCDDPGFLRELAGCGNHGPPEKCEPYFCASQQQAMGIAFAISLNDGFPPQELDHIKWIPQTKYFAQFQEKPMYYKY